MGHGDGGGHGGPVRTARSGQGHHAHRDDLRLPLQKGAQGRRHRHPDGSPKYTPHCLRHFFASTALASGIPIHEVSRWLGHRSIKTTVDVYGNPRELHQTGENPQVTRSERGPTGSPSSYNLAA
ncbi:tyrosine-type recombinase/integrase [Actinacidiphila oryziradicis]|uniref:tyrosine-type recombinase/integrase n=1 Tax=Actinacidiphila oryziradicis TaxID=2571141 RepID=UPI001FE25D0F|nr:tyrosine-type recombinase/integrase [Actinacidiphila oryziradicis]